MALLPHCRLFSSKCIKYAAIFSTKQIQLALVRGDGGAQLVSKEKSEKSKIPMFFSSKYNSSKVNHLVSQKKKDNGNKF